MNRYQSPICVNKLSEACLPDIHFKYDKKSQLYSNNTAIFMSEKEKHVGTLTISDTRSHHETKFDFWKIHFHTPSEHYINIDQECPEVGKRPAKPTSEMEVHIVHRLKGFYNGPDDAMGEFLGVASRMISVEGDSSKILTRDIECASGIMSLLTNDGGEFSINHLIPKDLSYYTYHGSLTSYPYTENAHWIIFKDHLKVDQQTMDLFKANIEKDACSRELQDIGAREVYVHSEKECTGKHFSPDETTDEL